MNRPLKVSIVAAAVAAALPALANAAGLGGINVYSALGQPLRAEVQIQASAGELEGMTAKVPSAEVFQSANMPYSALMSVLDVEVDQGSGAPVVRLSSKRAVNEPVVELLIELSWPEGSVVREYTLLLDPVDMRPLPAARSASAPTATVPARASSPEPAASSGTRRAATALTVQRGDTLYSLARSYQQPGVDINQMLIAFLRANPEAFIGGNINRLRKGAELKIPGVEEARSIAAADARAQVTAQKEAFEAYRGRIAEAAAAKPVQKEGGEEEAASSRESEGVVEPRVEEVVRDEDVRDQVQVSGAPSVENGEADLPSPATEEDAIAQNRALEEASSRVSELERMVDDQQRVIAMKEEAFAKQQADQQEQIAALQAEIKALQAQVTAKPKPQASRNVSTPGLLENPLVLGGGALVLGLLALFGVRVARRRREEKNFFGSADSQGDVTEPADLESAVVSIPGGEQVDTDSATGPSSVLDTDFSQSGLAAMDASEGVDPVAEADVYLAYGRDAQAEEILLDALKVDSSRHAIYVKLLEVYEQRGDRGQFEAVATDFYGRTGGKGAEWQQAADMGRRLDPENPLYRNDAEASAAAMVAGAAAAVAVEEPAPSVEEATPAAGFDTLEFGLDAPTADEQIESQAVEGVSEREEETLEDDNALAFDLDFGASEDVAIPRGDAGEALADVEVDLEKTEFDANVLDFDLDLSASTNSSGNAAVSEQFDTEVEPSSAAVPDFEAAPDVAQNGDASPLPELVAEDVQHEMETKLELARAYDDMGDKEGARELLEEVVRDGSSEQKAVAQGMLDRLA